MTLKTYRYPAKHPPDCGCIGCEPNPDPDMPPLVPEVHALDPHRRTNAVAVLELASLGYVPNPVIDVTYGRGSFHTLYRAARLTVNRWGRSGGDLDHDMRDPWPEHMWGRFRTVFHDPDYKLQGTPHASIDDRYGIDETRSMAERMSGYGDALANSATLVAPGWYLQVKFQDQVAGGKGRRQSEVVTDTLTRIGFRWVTHLHVHCPRWQDPERGQQHPRNNYSTLDVWQAPGRRSRRPL